MGGAKNPMPGALTNRFWSLRRDSVRDINLIFGTSFPDVGRHAPRLGRDFESSGFSRDRPLHRARLQKASFPLYSVPRCACCACARTPDQRIFGQMVCGRRWLLVQRACPKNWTHWDLNPGPSACGADVIPLHHEPT